MPVVGTQGKIKNRGCGGIKLFSFKRLPPYMWTFLSADNPPMGRREVSKIQNFRFKIKRYLKPLKLKTSKIKLNKSMKN